MVNIFDIKSYSKKVLNWIVGDIYNYLNSNNINISDSKITPQHLVELIDLVDNNKITNKMAKSILIKIFETGNSPIDIIKNENLLQLNNINELNNILNIIIEQYPELIVELKNKNKKIINFIIGKVMSYTKGKANPSILIKLINDRY